MSKAIVVGSINMDIVVFVKRHPKIGETVFGGEVKYFPGGKGANQAVACRRLGCATLLAGRLGVDAFGDQLLEFLEREDIDIRCVKRLENTATGTAFITVSENSDNSIVVIAGANSVWDDPFIDTVAIEPGDLVLAQFEIPDAVILKAFNKAKACGAMTLLNPAPVRAVAPGIREVTDIIVVNEHELAELSDTPVDAGNDESVFDAAGKLEKTGYRTIVVTLGEKGVRLSTGEQRHGIDARPVAAVDTTGAGDTFIGGFAAGLLSGLDVIRAAEFGNSAASIGVTRAGAAASIPTLAEVKAISSTR
ncbi:MAG: ribokinase [Gammaproteobacteria bacterium]